MHVFKVASYLSSYPTFVRHARGSYILYMLIDQLAYMPIELPEGHIVIYADLSGS